MSAQTTCTFQENCGTAGIDAAPIVDPIVLDLHKGANARFYRYQENVLKHNRVEERHSAIKDCADGNDCLIGARRNAVVRVNQLMGMGPTMAIVQNLSAQPTFDQQGRPANSMLSMRERSSIDYAAYHPEGQIKEARDRVQFLHNSQRHPRQCNLYGNLCGDAQGMPSPARPTTTDLSPEQADRPGTGFGGIPTI